MAKKLTEIQKQYKDVFESMKKQGMAAFKEAALEVFEKYPTVTAFKWSQYTPSWNDGSACTFNVNEDTLACQIEGATWTEDNGDDEGWFICNGTKESEAALNEFHKLLSPEELLETLFGTNRTVTVTRTEIETEDYDCGY